MEETNVVCEFEDGLRGIESELERLGRMVCSIKGGADSWNNVNDALEYVREAIRNSWKIEV